MDYFDAIEEISAAIGRFVGEQDRRPTILNVSPTLCAWIQEAERERHFLAGTLHEFDPYIYDDGEGLLLLYPDEQLSDFEIVPE